MADAIAREGHTTALAGDETCPQAVSISTMLAMIKKIREVEAFISTLDGQPSHRAAVNVYYKSALHLTGKRKAALSPDDRNYMAALLHQSASRVPAESTIVAPSPSGQHDHGRASGGDAPLGHSDTTSFAPTCSAGTSTVETHASASVAMASSSRVHTKSNRGPRENVGLGQSRSTSQSNGQEPVVPKKRKQSRGHETVDEEGRERTRSRLSPKAESVHVPNGMQTDETQHRSSKSTSQDFSDSGKTPSEGDGGLPSTEVGNSKQDDHPVHPPRGDSSPPNDQHTDVNAGNAVPPEEGESAGRTHSQQTSRDSQSSSSLSSLQPPSTPRNEGESAHQSPDGDPEVPPSKKPKSSQLAIMTRTSAAKSLAPPKFVFVRNSEVPALTVLRDRVYTALVHLEVDLLALNQRRVQGFTNSEAVEVTNFIFSELLGPEALGRLQTLVLEYTECRDEKLSLATIYRAETASHDPNNPADVRRFLQLFASSQRYTMQSRKNTLTSVVSIMADLALYHHFETITSTAGAGQDKQFTLAMQEAGFSTKRGTGWRTCVLKYLASILDMSHKDLRAICTQYQGIAMIVEKFGFGIIPLLPPFTLSRTRRWGTQRLRAVMNLLDDIVPFTQPFTSVLELHVYRPMLTGEPITIGATTSAITCEDFFQLVDRSVVNEVPDTP